jgi:U3 small nucleolar RNA-associated protein 12
LIDIIYSYSDFNDALMLIPFYAACEILQMMSSLMKRQYQAELVGKLILSLIQAHYGPFIASQELLPQIKDIEFLALQQVLTLRVQIHSYKFLHGYIIKYYVLKNLFH